MSGSAFSTTLQNAGEWFISVRWASSCTTMYSVSGGSSIIKRQLKFSDPFTEQLPQRDF